MPSDAPDDAIGRRTLTVDLLGSGSGFPTAQRDTTSLLVGAAEGWTLIDCPGSVVHKLAARGVRPADLRRVILTHNHVDHVYGFPHLVHALAIEGAVNRLEVDAPAQTLQTVAAMVRAHALAGAGYPRLELVEIALEEGREIVRSEGLRIRSAPACHGRDTVALRFDVAGASVCHSSDTRPCAVVERLARGVDMLFHDCAGPHRLRGSFADNHSSAREAARAAAAAEARVLVLLHLGVRDEELVQECEREAREHFAGTVLAAVDGARWKLPAD
jgi:ribonuclease Z